MNWHPTFPLSQVAPGSAKLFKHGRDQVAIFHRPEGVFAVDNRCPHEGYPLIQGTVAGCTLTCIWHNYKFNLPDGACVLGEEAVRSYPVRVVDGMIEVDLTPAPAATDKLWQSLHDGLWEYRMGRVIRDVARLIDAGVDPVAIAAWTAAFDARYGEYGLSHAPAVASEILHDLGGNPTLALAQALDLAGRGNLRRPLRPVPALVDPGDDVAGERFRAAVEAEDAALAEGLMRGAITKGWRRAELEPWMLAVCADHFLDFGHQLIYTIKLIDLLEASGWAHAADLLGGWTFGVVNATREDLLPAWAGYRARLGKTPEIVEVDLADATPKEAFARVANLSTAQALTELSLAASERLLRFNAGIDADPDVQEGWLDVTHRLTFVNAVRHAMARGGDRRLLLQAAQFVALGKPLDGPRVGWTAEDGDLGAAVRSRDEARALDIVAARGLTAARELRDLALIDLHQLPIFQGHAIKTIGAGIEEAQATGDLRPLLGAVRYLVARVQERSVHRLVGEALALVHEGRPPRTLTG